MEKWAGPSMQALGDKLSLSFISGKCEDIEGLQAEKCHDLLNVLTV